jgi:peptidoglycan/LPS O-acetylase OafA/YrhL
LIFRNGSVDNHVFIRAIPGFCGGIVAAYYRWRIGKTYALLACVVALIAIMILPIQWHAEVIAIIAFVIIVLATSQGFASSFLDSTLLKWLGDTSYSLYLFHPIMFVLFGRYLFYRGIEQPVIWVFLVGIATLSVAAFSFVFFESKMRKFWRFYHDLNCI